MQQLPFQYTKRRLVLAIAELKSDIASVRMMHAAREIRRLLLEQHYRPDQPRAPAGTDIGGQWIIDLGSARQQRLAEGDRVNVAQIGDPPRYRIDLGEEDGKGGHGGSEHVARTRMQLKKIMDDIRFRVRQPDGSVTYHAHLA